MSIGVSYHAKEGSEFGSIFAVRCFYDGGHVWGRVVMKGTRRGLMSGSECWGPALYLGGGERDGRDW